ncbi:MAG: glycosyltransferase family 39 protein [Anaerolineae bacterium]|nr:glycosyltransferase family 39 protein [Anaerolineae bacterium]
MQEHNEQQKATENAAEAAAARPGVFFALIVGGLLIVSLLTPAPLSTGILLLLLLLAVAYALFGLRSVFTLPDRAALRLRAAAPPLPRPSLPRSAKPYRNLLAAVCAVAAMALFAAAAIDFDPLLNQQFLNDGASKMLAGAGVLALAVLLSTRRPPLNQPIPEPLSQPHRRWRWVVFAGGLVLLILSESNGQFLKIEGLKFIHVNVQFAMLVAGALLVLYGLGGLPSIRLSALRVRREDRLHAVAVVAILILAAFLRLWNQEGTLRALIDELHWSDGLQRVVLDPWTPILYPMSGVSPYTNLFPYWQAGAVELLGFSWTGFRFVSAICGWLTVLAVYGLGRALFDRNTALLGMLVFAAFPPHIHFSRVAMALIGDPLFGTMAVMFIARALRRNHRIEWAAAGVSLGFSQYFYEGGRLLFPALVIGWLIVLAVSGHLKGRWRGVLILVTAFIFIGGPVYYTIIGNHLPLFGRMDVSGDGNLTSELSGGITMEEILARVQHALTAFMMYGAHHDLSAYYGGEQALVNTLILPLMLFGAFYLLWRFPAPAFLIPLWIVATGAGNGLLRDTLVSARYYVVLPPLALAIMAGVRYFLPFIAGIVPEFAGMARGAPDDDAPVYAVPRRRFLWRLAGAAALVICLIVSAYHIWYYFGPHLKYFNIQVRDSKGYRDGIDVSLRSVVLPGNTQTIIIGQPDHDVSVPRHFLTFLAREEGNADRFFPLLSLNSATVSPRYLRDLAPGVNYAFFVEPDEGDILRAIYNQFPNAAPPDYSVWDLPAHKEYVFVWAPVGSGR